MKFDENFPETQIDIAISFFGALKEMDKPNVSQRNTSTNNTRALFILIEGF